MIIDIIPHRLEYSEGREISEKVYIYRADVESRLRRWINGVRECLNIRGLTIQEAKECVKDRRKWTFIVVEERRR